MSFTSAGIAMGLGQGLLDIDRQRQQALQNALANRQMALQEENERANRAAQAAAQLPGGQFVPADIYQSQFANTPSAARFQPTPAQQGIAALQDDPNAAPGQDGTLTNQLTNPRPAGYETTEPFNQWKAYLQGQVRENVVNAQQTGANTRNAATNATREKIAKGAQAIQAERNRITQQLGQVRNSTAAGQLQARLLQLWVAEQNLRLNGAKLEFAAGLGQARIANSPGYQNQLTMSNLGLGDYPEGFDPTGIDKDVEEILKGLNVAPGAATNTPGAISDQAPALNQPPGRSIISATPTTPARN